MVVPETAAWPSRPATFQRRRRGHRRRQPRRHRPHPAALFLNRDEPPVIWHGALLQCRFPSPSVKLFPLQFHANAGRCNKGGLAVVARSVAGGIPFYSIDPSLMPVHSLNVIHRDLKSDNLELSVNACSNLFLLGLDGAYWFQAMESWPDVRPKHEQWRLKLTAKDTLDYMAPEILGPWFDTACCIMCS